MAVTRLVFPEPDGPRIAVVSPGTASNETSRKTRTMASVFFPFLFPASLASSSEPEAPVSRDANARAPRTVPSAFSTSSGGVRWRWSSPDGSRTAFGAPGARAPRKTPNGVLVLVPPPNAGRTHRERSETSTARGGSNARARVSTGGGSESRKGLREASSRRDSTRRAVSTRAPVVGASRAAAIHVVRSIFESTLRRRQERSRSAFSHVAPPAHVAAPASWASERSSAMVRDRVEGEWSARRERADSAREGRRVWEQAKKRDAARFCRQLRPSAERTSDFPRRLVTFRRDVFASITSGRARTAARVRAPGGRPSTLARRGGVARRDGVARAGQGAGGGHARRTGRESARGDPFSAVGVGSKGRLPLEPRCCWAFRSRLRA